MPDFAGRAVAMGHAVSASEPRTPTRSSWSANGRFDGQGGLPTPLPHVILFLDFDGVLHPDPCRDPARLFERARLLDEALRAFPEVGIVLSTSWRNSLSVDQLTAALPAGLAERVLGVTPVFAQFDAPLHLMPYSRHAECVRWLADSGQHDRDWIALDDRACWFAPCCEFLVVCDPATGLTEAGVDKLRNALTLLRGRMLRRIDALL